MFKRILILATIPSLISFGCFPTSNKDPVTAFVNVNLVPMTSDVVLPYQTVLVKGDRIGAVGPSAEIKVPRKATIIDGALGRGYQVGLGMQQGQNVKIISPGMGVGKRIDLLDALAEVENTNTATFNEVLAQIPAKYLVNAHTLLVSNHPEKVSADRLAELGFRSRHMELLGPEKLRQVFEDHPSVVEEVSNAS